MKKSNRIRPVVESLESMMLLSTATAGLHAVAQVAAEATTVALHGTIKGTGTIAGTTLTVHGSGKLGKVGVATLTGSGDLAAPPDSITIDTHKGDLVLTATEKQVISGTSGHVTYTISSGTGKYAGVTGSGLLSGTYAVHKNSKISFALHFS